MVVVDDNDVGDQPTHVDSHVVSQGLSPPAQPVQSATQPEPQPRVQPPSIESPPLLSSPQMAKLHALRARVAVLEERDLSKNDLIELPQDRLKSQDWQFGEVLNPLTQVQARMLPPPSVEIQEIEEEQANVGGCSGGRDGRRRRLESASPTLWYRNSEIRDAECWRPPSREPRQPWSAGQSVYHPP